MRTVLFGTVAVVAWSVLGYRLRHLRREPGNVFLRLFCLTTLIVAATFTVALPPVLSRLEQATGVLAIWYTGLIVVGCPIELLTFLAWTHPPSIAWRRIRPQFVLSGITLAAMAILDIRGAAGTRRLDIAAHAQAPELLYGTVGYVRDAMLLYLGYLAVSAGYSAHLTWQQASVADRRWLGRGLRVIATSCAMAVVMSLGFIIMFVGLRWHAPVTQIEAAATAVAGAGMLTAAVGVTMPTWGLWVDRYLAYHRLFPLWLATYLTFPTLILNPPAIVWLNRWLPWNINFRLYRRVVEIRDGWLALRPYISQQTVEHARHLAELSGLTGVDLHAAVAAHTLAIALHDKALGRTAAHDQSPTTEYGGEELTDEVEWLLKVTSAFTRIRGPVTSERKPVRTG